MDLANYQLPYIREKKQKIAKYEWQDIVAQIARLTNTSFGLCVRLWIKGGYSLIRSVLSELQQENIRRPEVYIKYLIGK